MRKQTITSNSIEQKKNTPKAEEEEEQEKQEYFEWIKKSAHDNN